VPDGLGCVVKEPCECSDYYVDEISRAFFNWLTACPQSIRISHVDTDNTDDDYVSYSYVFTLPKNPDAIPERYRKYISAIGQITGGING
jgi:hypothetical protein